MSKVPTFQWGGRIANAPPTIGFPGWFNINATNDVAVSLTNVRGRHTLKTGFYNTHSYKAAQTSNAAFGTINFQQDSVGTNPFDAVLLEVDRAERSVARLLGLVAVRVVEA